MARLTFDALFVRHTDNTLEPRQQIKVGGVSFGPGVRFSAGAIFGGIDFTQFIDRDFEVETEGNLIIIKGIY